MAGAISILVVCAGLYIVYRLFENRYIGRIYPNVRVDNIAFADRTQSDVKNYLLSKSKPFQEASFTLTFEGNVATVSGTNLNVGYDATLSATQAYLIGRSGHISSDLISKFVTKTINLSPYFHWDQNALDEALSNLSDQINIPVQEGLFQFSGGRVTLFKPSAPGRSVNSTEAKKRFERALLSVRSGDISTIQIPLPVDVVEPAFTTDRVNSFGIKELIGTGYSEFAGSIPGRIHNVALAAARLNGILIKPGDTFSFDEAVGDISAATGFQQAYVIKDGRTVLGDGGGVCQVSTTLFRTVLDAGLPVVERHAHAYRVHYYEEGGYKTGIDATVFAPSVDFKFKNDTPGYILIQSKPDVQHLTLTIEFYGSSDGRKAEIFNHRVWGITPPPPDLYQDDPTLTKGVVKQVDFAAWGTKAAFQYKVTRGSEVLQDAEFASNFRPWQAIYLKGTL
jgi:vancomycin resistance protein YoaR